MLCGGLIRRECVLKCVIDVGATSEDHLLIKSRGYLPLWCLGTRHNFR
jgi:hypothetical protein